MGPLAAAVSKTKSGKIILSTMNRCWMLGTLVFGSFIALGRNIRMTLEQPLSKEFLFFHTVPVNEKSQVRRILSENGATSFSFIYFDEEALAKERYLYRAGADEITGAMDNLLGRANKILDRQSKTVQRQQYPEITPDLYQPHLVDAHQVTQVQDDITVLGLAYFLTGSADYADHAATVIRNSFIHEQTQMPQTALFHSNADARAHIYQLLDAIQMLQSHFQDSETLQLQQWFTKYLTLFNPRDVADSMNHTGLYFDIEDMAVSHFVGDEARQAQIWKRALERLAQQIADDDSLPNELEQTSSCEHWQMYTLQGWWTLSRLFANAMGESLWTAEREALCRASARAIPYLNNRDKCNAEEDVDDRRWWPIVVETLRHCPAYKSTRLRWRDWMSHDSMVIPSSPYAMPLVFPYDTGIAPFWNFGMPKKKTEATHADGITTGKGKNGKSSASNKDPPGLHIPAKLVKAAEQDAEMEQRVSRIKRWHALGQVDIAEKMMKKALRDLRSTKIVWQPKDFIPQAMLDAAKSDEVLAERIGRIRRWHSLGQTSIVERMIKKTMDELSLEAEDEAAVQVLADQTASAVNHKTTFLRTQQHQLESNLVTSEASTATDSRKPSDDDTNKKESPSLMQKLLSSSRSQTTFIPPPSKESSSTGSQQSSRQIPPSLIQQAQNDPDLAKRISRIQRWKKLGQHEIADRMIQKLLASTEDQLF